MPERSEDELARTATAGADDAAAPELGSTLGRYRLERAIGEGGMGVVHAAFDPDLERRVALKVLRTAPGAGDEARQRLLREARAMARLTHPNVVTVHEVGTAGGRDYVAMELVEGKSLAEWLREEPRSRHEIVQAFVAAGRGLAAAHEAGLVHRDFKPHNVLRSRGGRICVTDFGLARGMEASGLETTVKLAAGAQAENTPSALSGLTATGSVLGTPAYMAPEQWSGGTVGPAADQFAFCVALWEALAGERPYRGATLEKLQEEVTRGPAALDASKLPRRLRGVLRRGLDPDPKRRWPSLDALLHALARAELRPRVALAGASSVVVAGAIAFAALRGGNEKPLCAPPEHAVDAVWPRDAGPALAAAGRAELRDVLQRDIDSWRGERALACLEQKPAALTCLDGVLARFDAIHRGLEHVTGNVSPDAVLAFLVDPQMCTRVAEAPRLVVRATPDTVAAFALAISGAWRDKHAQATPADAAALAAKPGLDPCARAYALRAQLMLEPSMQTGHPIANELLTSSEQCGDDRLRAEALIEAAPFEFETPMIGDKGRAAIAKAAAAVARVAQPDLVAKIDQFRARALVAEQHFDDALAAAARALAGYAARGRIRGELSAIATEHGVRFARGTPADLQAVEAEVHKWKPIARAHHFDAAVDDLEGNEAFAMLFLGDVMGAHAAIVQAYHPDKNPEGRPLDGTVVDKDGKPIAGAIVAAGTVVWADSVGPFPFSPPYDLRMVASDRDGHFMIPDAPVRGALMAQVQLRRGFATIEPHAKIVLEDTRKVSGKVELHGVPYPHVFVMIVPSVGAGGVHRLMAPLQPDGSFEMLAVPNGRTSIGVTLWDSDASNRMEFRHLPEQGDVSGLALEAPVGHSGRQLVVIARSQYVQSLDGAEVFLLTGRRGFKNLAELFATNHRETLGQMQVRYAKPADKDVPEAARTLLRAGDLVATFENTDAGEVTACTLGVSLDFTDDRSQRMLQEHAKDLEMRCTTARTDDKVIVVDVPPQKRLD